MTGLPKHLRDLDVALAALGDEAMTLSELDGYLAGLFVCPDLIPASEWLPWIWGEDGEPEDPTDADTLGRLIVAHGDDVLATLRSRPHRYAPLFDVYPPTDEILWELWIEGFEAAMSLRPQAWAPLVEEEGEANAALSLLLTLHQIARSDPELELDQAQIDELTLAAPDIIPGCVESLAVRRFGPSALVSPRLKVGRNDPCPCGSGKKYKKCCGAS